MELFSIRIQRTFQLVSTIYDKEILPTKGYYMYFYLPIFCKMISSLYLINNYCFFIKT